MSTNQLKFAVFLINKYALEYKFSVAEVFKKFDDLNIFDHYTNKHYEVLHTMSEKYLLNDINEIILSNKKVN